MGATWGLIGFSGSSQKQMEQWTGKSVKREEKDKGGAEDSEKKYTGELKWELWGTKRERVVVS